MRKFLSQLRSYCFFVPLVFVYTGVLGAASLAASLFDSGGRAQQRLARLWARMILATFGAPVEVEGLEQVETAKPHLYVCNHLSAVDIPVLYAHLRFPFRIMAKKELFRYPFLGWHLRRSGQIPIDASNALHSMRSLKQGTDTLRAGMPLVVFPEGGRAADGAVQPFMAGAFYVALKAQVEIIPLALVGTFEMLPMDSFQVRPRPLRIIFGRPIPTAGHGVREMAEFAARAQRAVEDMYYAHSQVRRAKGLAADPEPAHSEAGSLAGRKAAALGPAEKRAAPGAR